MEHFDLFIIGGGAAGIAAAKAAGVRSLGDKTLRVGMADRGKRLGGILCQCSHRGFGRQMTGREYADLLLEDFPKEVEVFLNTTVLSVEEDRSLVMASGEKGLERISFDRLILATGCREIASGALPIAGSRPKGVYTAGEMQAMMNLEDQLPEGPVVILGSGDLGLIMAEAISDAGILVTLVEQKDRCGGLARNRKKIEAGEIPLITGATISELCGKTELDAVIIKKEITSWNADSPSDGHELKIPCRTLLIAAGLKPERQLIRGLEEKQWLTLCGNCRQVHSMVEQVVAEGAEAGQVQKTGLTQNKKDDKNSRD